MNPASQAISKRRNLFKLAATFCLCAPLIGFAVFLLSAPYLATHLPQSRMGAILHVAIENAVLVIGFPGFILGVVALFGIRRHGAAGILVKVLVGFLLFLLMGIPASQTIHDSLVEISWQPPTKLAQKIVDADQVIIADYLIHTNDEGPPISVSGDKAKEIVNAVSLSRKDAGNYTSNFGRQIEFYNGTNLLASVRWQDRLFLTEEGQFSDNSGVLKGLYHKLFMQ